MKGCFYKSILSTFEISFGQNSKKQKKLKTFFSFIYALSINRLAMFPAKSMKKAVISLNLSFDTNHLKIIVFGLVIVHLKGLVSLFPVFSADIYGALAQIQWHIPSGGEKLVCQRTCTKNY